MSARARAWAPALASACAYTLITAILGQHVLAQLGTAIANDAGDPLLTAAILHWNAQHVPYSDAWWQFPIFHPTRDTLVFSEHLLGVSLIASPLAWLTGNPLATYNITMLLTFPLSAVAMYALVYRLTRSAAGAFVAGLAFAFAPYRMSTLSHIQSLAALWAPLALLGLHGYVGSAGPPSAFAKAPADRAAEPALHSQRAPVGAGFRGGADNAPRTRLLWLALYGAAWMLQGASNGYALVSFSTLIGLWVVWFVIARRRWRALLEIAAVTAVAALPLVPILYRYVTIHAFHGFERNIDEIRTYSADVAAVLCAPTTLAFWGWVRVACRGEGELFPGAAVLALFVAALAGLLLARDRLRAGRAVLWLRRVLLAGASVYALIIAAYLVAGPWNIEIGFIRLSASALDKPLLMGLALVLAAVLVSLGVQARSASATLAFYLFAAVTMWLFALGPTVTLMGEQSGRPGPFALLLPIASSLRVPARFWLMAVICLAVVAGLCVARLVRAKSRTCAAVVTVIAAAAVLADGWIAGIPAQPLPPTVSDSSMLRGQLVLHLPVEPYPDITSTWRAVTGGWRSVNGYSGYEPIYYHAVRAASKLEDDGLLTMFRRDTDLHVVVPEDATSLRAFVERQPGVVVTAYGSAVTQYRLPRLPTPEPQDADARVPIARVESRCATSEIPLLRDGDEETQWACGAGGEMQEITIDLGDARTISSVMYGLGHYSWEFASHIAIETSVDGASWTDARRGSILAEIIASGRAHPASLRVMLPFPPRDARYVRLRPVSQPDDFRWSIAELEVWSR